MLHGREIKLSPLSYFYQVKNRGCMILNFTLSNFYQVKNKCCMVLDFTLSYFYQVKNRGCMILDFKKATPLCVSFF